MKIRFAGLICHTTLNIGMNDEKQYAALIADAGHAPLLTVPDNYLISVSPRLTVLPGHGFSCIPIEGCVTTPTLGEGAALERDIEEVPSLMDVSTGQTPNPTIRECPPEPNVFHAVVHLPPYGLLTVDDYYLKQASFRAEPAVCLPRVIVYLVNTSDVANVRIEVHGEPVIISQAAEIFITNMSVPSADDQVSHFEYYKKFFYPEASEIDVPVPKTGCWYGTPQNILSCGSGSDLNVDCSNTRFP